VAPPRRGKSARARGRRGGVDLASPRDMRIWVTPMLVACATPDDDLDDSAGELTGAEPTARSTRRAARTAGSRSRGATAANPWHYFVD
jgi:hypothetical protein